MILIYGQDTFRSRARLKDLILHFKKKFDTQGYNVTSFREKLNLTEIHGAIASPPFLSTRRLVIVEKLLATLGKQNEVEEILKKIPESTICILWEEGDEKSFAKAPLFAKLLRKKETKTYHYPLLQAAQLEAWAREQIKNLGITFLRGAIQELVLRTGPDLWRLSSELEKFTAQEKPVTVEMIRDQVRGTTFENIFAFVDAVSSGNKKIAIRELTNERLSGVPVTRLISMLTWHFTMLCQAQDYLEQNTKTTPAELARVFKWHPFVARKMAEQAGKFNSSELARMRDLLFETERSLKTGIMEADSALDILIAKFILPQPV